MAKEYVELRNGTYYVADSRVSLDSVVHAFRRGESAETICQNFELLTLEEVYGAIAHYLANQAAVDAYLAAQEAAQNEARSNAEPLSDSLRARLQRAREEMRAGRPV